MIARLVDGFGIGVGGECGVGGEGGSFVRCDGGQ